MLFDLKVSQLKFYWFYSNLFLTSGKLHLNDVIQLFDGETLKELKAQCGGIQTLLKNNRNIFKGIFLLITVDSL